MLPAPSQFKCEDLSSWEVKNVHEESPDDYEAKSSVIFYPELRARNGTVQLCGSLFDNTSLLKERKNCSVVFYIIDFWIIQFLSEHFLLQYAQFIVSGQSKSMSQSGLVMLVPHGGMEGMEPERA